MARDGASGQGGSSSGRGDGLLATGRRGPRVEFPPRPSDRSRHSSFPGPRGHTALRRLRQPSTPPPYTGSVHPAGRPVPYGAPPPVYAQPGARERHPGLLIWSIVVTLFCCCREGSPAFVFANKANTAKKMGDFATARQAAQQAKTWLIISAVVGLL